MSESNSADNSYADYEINGEVSDGLADGSKAKNLIFAELKRVKG